MAEFIYKWLHQFNLRMHGRKELLLLDSASSHKVRQELNNVTVLFSRLTWILPSSRSMQLRINIMIYICPYMYGNKYHTIVKFLPQETSYAMAHEFDWIKHGTQTRCPRRHWFWGWEVEQSWWGDHLMFMKQEWDHRSATGTYLRVQMIIESPASPSNKTAMIWMMCLKFRSKR